MKFMPLLSAPRTNYILISYASWDSSYMSTVRPVFSTMRSQRNPMSLDSFVEPALLTLTLRTYPGKGFCNKRIYPPRLPTPSLFPSPTLLPIPSPFPPPGSIPRPSFPPERSAKVAHDTHSDAHMTRTQSPPRFRRPCPYVKAFTITEKARARESR